MDDARGGAPASSPPVVALVGGTGKLGSALAVQLARAGVSVVVGSRDRDRAVRVARELDDRVPRDGLAPAAGAITGADNATAVSAAGVVVVTVPYPAQADTLRGLAGAVGDRVVISTAVPVTFSDAAGPEAVAVAEGSAAEQVASLLPRARVVAALHTLSSATLARLDRPVDADILVTGDDPHAKLAAADVIARLPSVRVVDAGPLRNSRYVEQLTVLLLSVNMRVRRNTGIRVTNLPDDRAMPAHDLRGDHA